MIFNINSATAAIAPKAPALSKTESGIAVQNAAASSVLESQPRKTFLVQASYSNRPQLYYPVAAERASTQSYVGDVLYAGAAYGRNCIQLTGSSHTVAKAVQEPKKIQQAVAQTVQVQAM